MKGYNREQVAEELHCNLWKVDQFWNPAIKPKPKQPKPKPEIGCGFIPKPAPVPVIPYDWYEYLYISATLYFLNPERQYPKNDPLYRD